MLTRVKAQFNDFEVYDLEPSSMPDVMAERPLVFFGKYKGGANGSITVKGHSGRKKFKTTFDVASVKPDRRNAALRYLWARERVRLLDDHNNLNYDEGRVKEVSQLGLDFNLMTAYTSFVAVDEELIAQFKKRYPHTEINWGDALSRQQPVCQKDVCYHIFNVPIVWTVAYADEKNVPDLAKWSAQKKWLQRQNELQDLLKEYKMPLENFQWTFLNTLHELKDGEKVSAIKAIGLCTVLAILNPVDSNEI